jgi:multidrug efflux system membrane fusion protein
MDTDEQAVSWEIVPTIFPPDTRPLSTALRRGGTARKQRRLPSYPVFPYSRSVVSPAKVLIPLAIVTAMGGTGWYLSTQTAPAQEVPHRPALIPVTASALTPRDYTVVVPTQGEVRARTESSLIPEVSGMIKDISPSFREGGFFEAGEELVKLDDRDHKAAVVIAQSAVAQAATLVSEENARAAQALEDWKNLGREGEPDPLVLRKPQLAEAGARLESAQATLDRAKRDDERTSIKAPYAGRIVQKLADVGQFVSSGRELAQIYAVDAAEIDLPLRSDELAFLDLPEHFRGEKMPVMTNGPEVTFTAPYAGRTGEWKGQLVRVAGGIDQKSRQLYVTAQVLDPYARRGGDNPPLKVGMFVNAHIKGRTLKNVFVIPRVAMREGDQVLLVDGEQKLRNRTVKVIWGGQDHVVVSEGLKPGELLCTTALHYAVEGSQVKVNELPMTPMNIPGSPAPLTKSEAEEVKTAKQGS